MRLLERIRAGQFRLTKDFVGDDEIPPYAILSHTWGADTEEVTFKDLIDGSGKSKPGYEKIRFCGEQAKCDGLRHFWVDTCCIDKSNNNELSEAINSMFRWYRDAAKCYVYLSDVSITKRKASDQSSEFTWESAFRASRWFTRGWTLQELLAPGLVEFFSQEGKRLGDKRTLERQIHEITAIAVTALRGTPLSQFGVDERLSWAKNRQTTRKEDKAYSLLGVFDVYMPLIYGEGEDNALTRLREGIDKPSKALDRLPYAVDAPFNSYAKQDSPSCLPNTRVDLLQEIYSWADGQDKRCIFWLNGLAGTGKSTIARTVARRYFNQKSLGASFFFSRGGGDVGRADKFVTSIAVQLASSVRTLRRYISDAVTEHSDIASRYLRDQWQQLVLGPLSKMDGSGGASYIVVIDALDECDDENNIRIILQLLAEARSLERVRLRVFLTSRPEVAIRHGFYQMSETEHRDFVLHNTSPSIVDHDIGIFLEYNLKLIGEAQAQDAGWPGAEVIETLVQSASGLFIWAATACRYIREGRRFAAKRLDIILKGSGSAVIAPEKHLNEIYITILKHSVSPEYTDEEKEESYRMLGQILGTIAVLVSPLSAYSLSRLLCITKKDIDQTLEDLHSVLDIPKDQKRPFRLHHPSFRDFLLDENRCGDSNFWVEEKRAHRMLADSCIQLMSTSLKQDICGVGSPGGLATEVESSQLEQYMPPEVQYACLYWAQHLQKGGAQLHDNDQVHQFLKVHLLHRLEALSWMRRVSNGIYAVSSLELIASASRCPNLGEFIHDIKRFALYNRLGIEQTPLQIYCSALVFAPATSIVKKQFNDQVSRWIRRLPKVEDHWNALLQTLEGHSFAVEAVAFSPDGKLLASASNDKTIRLWDASSGAALQTLKGHLDWVRAVTFSPDGRLLASASEDNTVRLWDAGSGALLQTLDGYSGGVSAVAFSPDSKLLASASRDNTVRRWDASSGALLQTLEGHSSGVSTAAFSPDGKLLASASHDDTVRLWDTSSGVLLQMLEGHQDWVIAVAFSPDGKLLASASNDIRLWDASSGAARQTLEGHLETVRAIAFSPDGKLLASASNDKTIRLWDASSGAALQTLKGHLDWVKAVTFSPDGRLLASASEDNTVRLWDVRLWDTGSGATRQTLEGHSGGVSAVAFSPDGKLLASASHDNTVRLWDTGSGAALQTIQVSTVVWTLSFTKDRTAIRTGLVPNKSSFHPATSSRPTLPPSLLVKEQWVSTETENILWLPPEYRPGDAAVYEKTIAIGSRSDRVLIFECCF